MLRRERLVFSVVGEKVRPSLCSAARHASSITLRAVSVVDDRRLHTAYGRHGVRLCRPGGVGDLSRASPSLLDDTEECPAQPTTREVACIWTFLRGEVSSVSRRALATVGARWASCLSEVRPVFGAFAAPLRGLTIGRAGATVAVSTRPSSRAYRQSDRVSVADAR